jgi:HD-like signal output (HDOD) protein
MPAVQLTRDQILDAAWHTEHLPPYPGIVTEVERELSKPEPAPARVAAVLSRDPALCAAVLRMANSAAHASRSEATTIPAAIVRLGLRQTRRIVLSAALVQRWPAQYGINQKAFWSHSISVALMANELTKYTSVTVPPEIQDSTFTAGILHDLGALVLAKTFPDQYRALELLREQSGRSAVSLELEHFGIDHGEIGGVVACRWNIPDSLRDAVAFHHQPWQARREYRLLTQLIHVADFLCSCQGISRAEDGIPDDFDNSTWDALGLRIEQAHSLFESVNVQGEQSTNWVSALQGDERDQTWRRST